MFNIKIIRELRGLKIDYFAKKLGVSRQSIYDWEEKGVIPRKAKLDEIAKILQVSVAELFDDYTKIDKGLRNEAREIENQEYMMVPLVTQPAQAGYVRGFNDPEYIESLPTFPAPVDREYKGKYRWFEVKGDSMEGLLGEGYREGDRLLCRDVKRELWRDKLHINKYDFVIVTLEEGIVVKQISHHDVAKGVIRCHSLNPIYEDFELALNDVVELFNVITFQRSAKR